MVTRKEYNEVVNIKRERGYAVITVLQETFSYDDGLHGATGSDFEPVSQAYYDEATSEDRVKEMLDGSGIVEDKIGRHATDEQRQEVIDDFYQSMLQNGEIDEFVFDFSYMDLWDMMREYGFPEDKYPVFNCIGGGRMFDANYQGNTNRQLSKVIRDAERGNK